MSWSSSYLTPSYFSQQYWPHVGALQARNLPARPLDFLLVQSSDHRTPATGLSPVVMLSKNGGPFALAQGVVSELGYGWYQTASSGADTDTLGPLIVHADPNAAAVDVYDGLKFVAPSAGAGVFFQKSTAYPFPFLMVANGDHLTGLAGLSPSVLIAGPGQAFAAPGGPVAEVGGAGRGKGWYTLAPTTADAALAGPLLLHASAAGADVTDVLFDLAPVGGAAPTRFASILLAIEGLIVATGLYGANQVFATLDDDPWPATGAVPFCALRPGGSEGTGPQYSGGGTHTPGMRSAVTIRVIAGRASDIEGRDQYALLNQSVGLYDVAVTLMGLLAGQFPMSPNGSQLTQTELRPLTIREPRRSRRDPNWRGLDLVISFDWTLKTY